MTVYRKISDLPAVIPVFPLDGAILFPKGQLPLNIFEPRYLNMVDDALAGDRLIGMIQTTDDETDGKPGLARIGTVGRLTAFAETDDGRYLITLTGITRFSVKAELDHGHAYREVEADYEAHVGDLKPPLDFLDFDRQGFLPVVRAYLEANDLKADWSSIEDAHPELLINALSAMCPFEPIEKQALLEASTLKDRQVVLETLMRMDTADGLEGPMQ